MSDCFLFVSIAGDGVLWRRFSDGFDQEHKRELSEGRVDRVHLQRNPQGEYMFTGHM